MAELLIKNKTKQNNPDSKYPVCLRMQALKVLQKQIFPYFFCVFPGNFYAHLCAADPG